MSGATRCKLLEINAASGTDFTVTADHNMLRFKQKDPDTQKTTELLSMTGTGINVGNITVSGTLDIGNSVLEAVNAQYQNLAVTTALNVGAGATFRIAQTDPITNFTEWTAWTPAPSTSTVSNFVVNQAKYSLFNKTANAWYDLSMQTGPYAHWKFDNSAADSGGLGYTGTLLAGSSYSSTALAIGTHSLLTTGSTGGMTIDHAALKTVLGGDFTLSCWFHTTNAATQNQVIVASGGFTFDLRYNYNGDGKLTFFDRGNTTQFTRAAWTPVANTWYHILLRRSGDLVSMSVGTIGTEWASFTSLATNNNPGGTKQALTGVLRIGQKSGTSEFMNGYLDDFAVYDKVADATFLSRLAGRSASAVGITDISVTLPPGIAPGETREGLCYAQKNGGDNTFFYWFTTEVNAQGLVETIYCNNTRTCRGNCVVRSSNPALEAAVVAMFNEPPETLDPVKALTLMLIPATPLAELANWKS
eukprot:jgi/Mesvir1/14635/Mv05305-RA.1